jgi:CheY-like chemotaxis protein
MPDDKGWVKPSGPIVVAMDVKMPHLDGSEATRKIAQSEFEFVVIGLSVRQDKETNGDADDRVERFIHERVCRKGIASVDCFNRSPARRQLTASLAEGDSNFIERSFV